MPSPNHILCALLGLTVLAGCATKPPPDSAEIRQQALTNVTLPSTWKAGGKSGSIADNWVATFDDKQLDALVREAITNNLDLRITATRVEQAAHYVQLARAATSPETCDVMQLDAARIFGPGTTVDCREVVSRGSEPGAEVVSLDILEPEVGITAFKHIHSATVPTDPDNPVFAPVNNIPDPRDADLFPPGQPLSSVLNLRTTGFGGGGGRVSLFYQFVVRGQPNFTLVWHNTGGPLKEQAPQLIGLLESLPKTDVELGSVVTLGFGTNGLRDPVTYMRLIRPKIFIPGHLTAVARESSSLEWRDAFLKEIDILNIPKDERPDIRWVVDPTDYIRPMVFDPKAARWAS